MEQFSSYVGELQELLSEAVQRQDESATLRQRILASLDGGTAAELRRRVPMHLRRASGAFFTGSRLASLAVAGIADTLNDKSVVLDPACGAGDLLLACATALESQPTARSTARAWGRQLVGRDIEPEFVAAARVRLALLGLTRARSPGNVNALVTSLVAAFEHIAVGCGRSDIDAIARATHILVNPPFNTVQAPPDCDWACGGVNHAAVFLEQCVTAARPGTLVAAILPDVLRSGTRYEKWRRKISRQARVTKTSVFGIFDSATDVDVFLLHLVVDHATTVVSIPDWTSCGLQKARRLGDDFDVSVGPVVDYRSPRRGPKVPYVRTCDLPPWGEARKIRNTRQFSGRLFSGPFVAVRRNSRPDDRHRIVPTLVLDSRPIAVENHVLVLKPRDGTVTSCRSLKNVLREDSVSTWMNQRLRLRHLTVRALRDLPLP